MNRLSRGVAAIVLAGIWVNASEFLRNEVLLKAYWVDHYLSLGMTFPSGPVNGMVWVAWGFSFALAIYLVSRRFDLMQTTFICWFTGFVLMWVVTLNLNVLPAALLLPAAPLSLLEAFVGSWVCLKMSPPRERA